MSSDSKHSSDPTRKPGGSTTDDSPAITKAPGLTTGEPERREFSDKFAGSAKHANSNESAAAMPKVQGVPGVQRDSSGKLPETQADNPSGGKSGTH